MKQVIFFVLLFACGAFAQSSNNFSSATTIQTDSDALDAAVKLNNRAVELCVKNLHAEAVPLLRKALEIKPNLLTAVKNLGIALYLLKEYDEAIERLEKVRAEDALIDAKTLVYLGEALFAKRKNKESLSVLHKALEIEPGNAVARYNYGAVLQEMARYEKAIEQYDQALALQPNFAKALNNRGMTHYLLGNYKKSLTDLQKALALETSVAEIHNNLGAVYSHLGKKKAAHKYFLEAVRLNPEMKNAQYNLALSYREFGRRDEAFRHFLRLRELDANLAEQLRKEMSKNLIINASEVKE
jgi:tetratricopeptide (TPR) repeat protein